MVCKVCGKEFAPANPRQKVCSEECKKTRHLEVAREWSRKKGEAERRARTVEKTCPVCGQAFTTDKACKIYCSKTCQKKTKKAQDRERSRERYQAERVDGPRTCTCEFCGKTFEAPAVRKYCSKACMDAEQYRRRNERRREERRKRREAGLCRAPGRPKRSDEKRSDGGLTGTQRERVDRDLLVEDPAKRYRRSQEWTLAMRRYAARRYLELNTIRAGTNYRVN